MGDLVAAVITQGLRTAQWLGNLPLPRLRADDGAIATEAYAIVVELDRVTRRACRAGAGELSPECPPTGAVPPLLAPHAAGAQLRVFVDQFARAAAMQGCGALDPADLRELAARCLALRT